jgi:hypothetical protein
MANARATAERKTDIQASAIVRALPRALRLVNPRDPNKLHPKERALAGTYRIIHGTVLVSLPVSAFTGADGKIDPWAPTFVEAKEGDEVELTDEDAAVLMDSNQIEELDAKPSRVGKVFAPPKPIEQFSGHSQAVPEHAATSRW